MSKKNSFWSTIPGILTGFAAIIGAVSGLLLALSQAGLLSNSDKNGTPQKAMVKDVDVSNEESTEPSTKNSANLPEATSIPATENGETTQDNRDERLSECKTLTLKLSAPVEIEKGDCFGNNSNTQKSFIKLITRNAIIFSNCKGKEITCSMGETCSFGWPGAPIFHVVSNAYPEENAYIVGAN